MVHIVMSNRLNADNGWTDLCGLESVSVYEPFGNRTGPTGSRDALKRAPTLCWLFIAGNVTVLGPGLDGGAGLHYRKKMALMSRRTTVLSKADVPPLQLGKAGVSPWRVGLCLLLGLFFLYNPFFTICVASGPSAVVHHPVSYRSTIASSELGCGTVQLTKVQAAPLEAFVAIEKALLLQADDSRPKPEGETVRAVTQDFASSLWFRPPPIL
jgi:hypothetical protein